MNKHIQNFKKSLKFKKDYFYTLFVDLGFFGIMWFLVFYFGNIIKQKADAISNGQTPEQLQKMLLNMQSGQSEALLANIQSFIFIFIIGLIIIVIGGLLLFSLSRKLIWSRLTGKRFSKKKYWKWNLLNLSLVIPVIFYLFVFGIGASILTNIIALLKNQIILDIFNNFFTLFSRLSLFVFLFLVYFSFVEKYKVWESIGDAFHIIKSKWKKIWPMFLLVLMMFSALFLFLLGIGKTFRLPANILSIINLIFSFLLLIWMRIYVYKTIKNEPETIH